MRFINITDLKETFDTLRGTRSFSKWEKRAEEHLAEIETQTKKERSIYWQKNNIWAELYCALSELSGHKCWYTETKENSSEWQVDHFRPKGKSVDQDGRPILDEGYWWLSYAWQNFRLAGSLVNLLRKGRFDERNETKGKGNFFPLKETENVSKPKDKYCSGEKPILLDPTNASDVSLIAFDQDGMPYPTFNEEDSVYKHQRAIISIKCYGLEHQPLIRGRKRVWDTCLELVERAQNDLNIQKEDDEKVDEAIEKCFQELAILASKKSPHSSVVFDFIKMKSEDENFQWLKGALIAIV